MAEFDNLHKLFTAAVNLAAIESGVLLGQPFELLTGDSVVSDKKGYFTDKEDPFFVATVESGEEYPGELHLIFSLRDAILLSSLLLGITTARIEEKRNLAIMETDDGDAFAEILNQVIGSFNSEFTTTLPHKVHLKLLPPKKFVPGTDLLSELEPLPEGEYCLFSYPMKLNESKTDQLDILIPLALARLFDPQGNSTAAEPESVLLPPEIGINGNGTAESQQTILILEDDPSERRQTRDILSATGLRLIDAPFSADYKTLCPDGTASMAVIGVADCDKQDFAIRTQIAALCQAAPFPILLCAERWTRSAVMKALSYGAREIILKPYDADMLLDRVNKLMKAA